MKQSDNASSEALLQIESLRRNFAVSRGMFAKTRSLCAVDDVSFSIFEGECLGLVGESGCGKSTLGRMILQLLPPTSGRMSFQGEEFPSTRKSNDRALRGQIQIVFQDPFSSLNPRMRVCDIIAEPLHNQRLAQLEIIKRTEDVVRDVGLKNDCLSRYPHSFSGGQRQRIGLARALVQRPKLLVCDEAVSALDVSVQAQILNLLHDIRLQYQLTLLFISHNLSVVRHIADRVAVMYLGQLVELGSNEQIFLDAHHPYTQSLLSAVLEPSRARKENRVVLGGELPSPLDPPSGCYFSTRCPIADDRCCNEVPEFRSVDDNRYVRCHKPGEFHPQQIVANSVQR